MALIDLNYVSDNKSVSDGMIDGDSSGFISDHGEDDTPLPFHVIPSDSITFLYIKIWILFYYGVLMTSGMPFEFVEITDSSSSEPIEKLTLMNLPIISMFVLA